MASRRREFEVNRLLHHLEAGVIFMFAMTLVSLATVLYYLGGGLWSIWFLSLMLSYALGRVGGAVKERAVNIEHERRNHD